MDYLGSVCSGLGLDVVGVVNLLFGFGWFGFDA